MPRSRERGGTRMPRAGEETPCPAMLISPDVGCSRPATQRKVVVLPQPEGPSRTTISPAGTAKLTPSIAGRPTKNCLRRSVTSSVAVMISISSSARRSLPVAEGLVPIGHPGGVQLHILVEIRIPDLDDLGIETFGIQRHLLKRRKVTLLLDHEGLALLRQAPVQVQPCSIDMRSGLRDSRRIGIGGHALRREHDLQRRAFLLLRINGVLGRGSHPRFRARRG